MSVLVEQTLEELATEGVDIAGALAMSATTAWRQGYQFADGQDAHTVVEPGALMDLPGGSDVEYIVLIADPATGEVDAEGPITGVTAMIVADQVRLELNASGHVISP